MEEKEVIEGYSPSFSNDGFTDNSVYTETIPDEQTNEADLESSLRPRKKKVSSDRRFDQLMYERDLLEQQNNFKNSVIEDQQRQLQEIQNQLQHKDKLSNDYFETALQERESAIIREIKRAKEDGDVDVEVKLIEELADIKAKKSTNSLFQYQQQEQAAERVERFKQQDYVPIETTIPTNNSNVPAEFREWLEENTWYNTSPRLRQEADVIAQDLSDRFAFNNEGHLIGTPYFFQCVTDSMQDRYRLANKAPARKMMERDAYEDEIVVPEYESPVNNVAPVTRRGINMADQYVQNRFPSQGQNTVRALTKEEYAIARHLPIRQKGEGEVDLVRRYAQAKNYPRSPLEGGSPWRLTIR
jgi:hypothetical protein